MAGKEERDQHHADHGHGDAGAGAGDDDAHHEDQGQQAEGQAGPSAGLEDGDRFITPTLAALAMLGPVPEIEEKEGQGQGEDHLQHAGEVVAVAEGAGGGAAPGHPFGEAVIHAAGGGGELEETDDHLQHRDPEEEVHQGQGAPLPERAGAEIDADGQQAEEPGGFGGEGVQGEGAGRRQGLRRDRGQGRVIGRATGRIGQNPGRPGDEIEEGRQEEGAEQKALPRAEGGAPRTPERQADQDEPQPLQKEPRPGVESPVEEGSEEDEKGEGAQPEARALLRPGPPVPAANGRRTCAGLQLGGSKAMAKVFRSDQALD